MLEEIQCVTDQPLTGKRVLEASCSSRPMQKGKKIQHHLMRLRLEVTVNVAVVRVVMLGELSGTQGLEGRGVLFL